MPEQTVTAVEGVGSAVKADVNNAEKAVVSDAEKAAGVVTTHAVKSVVRFEGTLKKGYGKVLIAISKFLGGIGNGFHAAAFALAKKAFVQK